MTYESTESLVRTGDPDRFAAAMTAAPDRRGELMALYAFNLEVSRAPWKAPDPHMVAIRLQWWRDAVEGAVSGGKAPPHPVAEKLSETIRARGLPAEPLLALIAARHPDFAQGRGGDRDRFSEFINSTAGGVMWLAARILGAPGYSEQTVRGFAWGAGAAAYLRAAAALRARGGLEFLRSERDFEWVVMQATERIRNARRRRGVVPAEALPALLAGWRADAALRRAKADISAVMVGALDESEFERRGRLLIRSLTGKW